MFCSNILSFIKDISSWLLYYNNTRPLSDCFQIELLLRIQIFKSSKIKKQTNNKAVYLSHRAMLQCVLQDHIIWRGWEGWEEHMIYAKTRRQNACINQLPFRQRAGSSVRIYTKICLSAVILLQIPHDGRGRQREWKSRA